MNCLICGQQHDTTICPDKPIPVSPNLFCPACGYALDGWLRPDPRLAALVEALELISKQAEVSLATLRRIGWKYEDSENMDQKVAFTMYSKVVLCSQEAKAALAAAKEEGR